MNTIIKYRAEHETELLLLLAEEPDWSSFVSGQAIERFKSALLYGETYVCFGENGLCGYVRAMVDAFGIYVSELYVAPEERKKGYGRSLLVKMKNLHPDQEVYVLSDEDSYYEKLGYKCVGSVFQL